jgi:hypothetical protein
MRKLAKMLAVLALAATASATGLVGAVRAHAMALSPCYYDEHADTSWFHHLTWDSNYVNVTLSIWEVDSLACSGWAGHNFGDIQVEVEANLGTTQDYFINNLNPISMFGCSGCGESEPSPAASYWNKIGYTYGTGAPWRASGGGQGQVWGLGVPPGLTGTDGDTTIYENSGVLAAACGTGGIAPVWVSDGAANFWPSEVDISGNEWELPLYNFYVKGIGQNSCDFGGDGKGKIHHT